MKASSIKRPGFRQLSSILFFVAMPVYAWAQTNGGLGETRTKLCGFLENLTTLLNMASIAIVTIAIIFSGYQIAFAHKRINDVAPILIGGLLIGAATQIARMLIGDQAYCGVA